MSVVPFSRRRRVVVANDDEPEFVFRCAACKGITIHAILDQGRVRLDCAGCKADLTDGVFNA